MQANRAEFESGMAKQGLYKEFLDEVEPLCGFAELAYPPQYKVQPVIGNQGYGALVFDPQGIEVDKVELTMPYDGGSEALRARQVVKRGYSDMQIINPAHLLDDLIPFIRSTSQGKSLRDYSGITLVFFVAAPPALAGLESIFEEKIREIMDIITQKRFRAKRVFLYIPPGRILSVQ